MRAMNRVLCVVTCYVLDAGLTPRWCDLGMMSTRNKAVERIFVGHICSGCNIPIQCVSGGTLKHEVPTINPSCKVRISEQLINAELPLYYVFVHLNFSTQGELYLLYS